MPNSAVYPDISTLDVVQALPIVIASSQNECFKCSFFHYMCQIRTSTGGVVFFVKNWTIGQRVIKLCKDCLHLQGRGYVQLLDSGTPMLLSIQAVTSGGISHLDMGALIDEYEKDTATALRRALANQIKLLRSNSKGATTEAYTLRLTFYASDGKTIDLRNEAGALRRFNLYSMDGKQYTYLKGSEGLNDKTNEFKEAVAAKENLSKRGQDSKTVNKKTSFVAHTSENLQAEQPVAVQNPKPSKKKNRDKRKAAKTAPKDTKVEDAKATAEKCQTTKSEEGSQIVVATNSSAEPPAVVEHVCADAQPDEDSSGPDENNNRGGLHDKDSWWSAFVDVNCPMPFKTFKGLFLN